MSRAARSPAFRIPIYARSLWIVGRQAPQDQLGVAADHAEQVVEVVGAAAREAADALHLLGLAELCLEPLARADVHDDSEDPGDCPAGVVERCRPDAQIEERTILPAPADLDPGEVLAPRRAREELAELRFAPGRHGRVGLAHDLVRAPTKDSLGRRVPQRDVPLGREHDQRDGGRREDSPERLVAGAGALGQRLLGASELSLGPCQSFEPRSERTEDQKEQRGGHQNDEDRRVEQDPDPQRGRGLRDVHREQGQGLGNEDRKRDQQREPEGRAPRVSAIWQGHRARSRRAEGAPRSYWPTAQEAEGIRRTILTNQPFRPNQRFCPTIFMLSKRVSALPKASFPPEDPCSGSVGMNIGDGFGRRVRSVRLARGLTQEELAGLSDLSVDAIRRIERAAFSPSLRTMSKLCDGLSISLRTLFDDFVPPRRDDVEYICDYLHRRSRGEVSTVWRVIRAIFAEA